MPSCRQGTLLQGGQPINLVGRVTNRDIPASVVVDAGHKSSATSLDQRRLTINRVRVGSTRRLAIQIK